MKKILTGLMASAVAAGTAATTLQAASFGDDLAFLQKHTPMIVLSDPSGAGKVAVSPAWQGRVMTSSTSGDAGLSFGWINRELIASGKLQPHINVFGGEDRFWLGPEGGQFSIFFAQGAERHWKLASYEVAGAIPQNVLCPGGTMACRAEAQRRRKMPDDSTVPSGRIFVCNQPDTPCLANFRLSLRDDASGANAIRFNSFNARGKPRKLSGLGFSLDAGHPAETG